MKLPKCLRRPRSFYSSFFALLVPIMLQNLISSSMGLVDTFMVGTLGQDALGGLSLANTPFFVAMLFVFGLQSGGTVLMSQYWGKRDMETINRVLGISFMFAVGASFLFATAVFLFPEQVMGLTTNNPVLLDVAVRYGRIVAYSYVLNAFSSLYIGALRCCERPRFGTIMVMVGMVANIFFNYIFIFGKLGFSPMGVEGAALGTLAARSVEFLIVIGYMICTQYSKKQVLKIMPSKLVRPGMTILRDFLRYASPVMANETLWGLGTSMFAVIYGHMADSGNIMAAYSISRNIDQIVTVAVMAVASSTAVFVGKAIGTGESKENVQELGKTFVFLSFAVGFVSGGLVILVLFAVAKPFLFPLFGLTAGAAQIATIMLLLRGLTVMFFRSFNATLVVGILRGGGDVTFGLLVDVGPMWLIAIPLSALAGLVLQLDFVWVFLFVLMEDPLKCILGLARFFSRKWIRNVTRDDLT